MRILTGIQPSGKLHWGNYFGAMQPSIAMQEKGEAFIFIAQYHALTTVHDAAALRQATFDVAADFLACGLDPAKACLFRQADVPEVHELAWLLSTVTAVIPFFSSRRRSKETSSPNCFFSSSSEHDPCVKKRQMDASRSERSSHAGSAQICHVSRYWYHTPAGKMVWIAS